MKNNFIRVKFSLTKKLFVGFLIICIVVGLSISFFAYLWNRQYIFDSFSKQANSCALDAANMLHNAPFDEFLRGNQQQLYQQHLKSIRNIANSFGLKYLYVYVPDTVNNKLVGVFGVEGKTGNIIEGFDIGQSPKNLTLNDKVMKMFMNCRSILNLEMDNEYGHVLTGYSTIKDENSNPVAIVGADIDYGEIIDTLFKDTVEISILIFVCFSIVYILAVIYVRKTFIKYILLLSSEMKNFVTNNKFHYNTIKLDTNDEFGIMADSYNIMSKNIETLMKDLFSSQMETIFSLAKLTQTRDENTGKHIERVQQYCKILSIGILVNKLYPKIVDRKFIRNIVSASSLHDIGKVAISDILLLSPNKLSKEEKEKMQIHTIYGEQALAKINSKYGNNEFIKIGMLIARHHHERWDGTGYPDKLKGENIPLVARIMTIADVYDALSTKRTYKEAFSHSKCVQIILEEKGKMFDPQLVDIFMKIEQKFLKIREQFEKEENQ